MSIKSAIKSAIVSAVLSKALMIGGQLVIKALSSKKKEDKKINVVFK